MKTKRPEPDPPLFAVLHFPQFLLQAALRHDAEAWGRPVALVDPAMSTPRVIDATDAARAAGVEDGLTAPQALARCREVRIRHRSADREAGCTEAILQCAYGFSPHLEATGPGTVTLDLRGLAGLKGALGVEPRGEGPARHPEGALKSWAEGLLSSVGALGLRARVGLGGTPNVAMYAARWAGVPGVAGVPRESASRPEAGGRAWVVADAAAFVSQLPVAALGPSEDVLDLLRRWGISTVGELLRLGQAELAERLGLEALGLFAAASVKASRPLRMVQPPQRFEESHEFEPPVEMLEPLLFFLRRFADSLARRLDGFGLAVGALRLVLRLESGVALERILRLPEPTRRSEVLFRMLYTHLEGVRTESPLKAVLLAAEPARPQQRQFNLFEASLRDPHQFQETLARLAALLGAERVGSPRREDSHRPDAFTLVPPEFEEARPPAGKERFGMAMRRVRPAMPAQVQVEEGEERPVAVRSALGSGRLAGASGPWRSSGHWWDDTRWNREEWDVATREGLVLRIAREGGSWRVDAVLD